MNRLEGFLENPKAVSGLVIKGLVALLLVIVVSGSIFVIQPGSRGVLVADHAQ